jgi:arylsulfatase A-like enzyme
MVDDLGYGDLSSYGATDLRTPQIDRLAERGMQFSRFYANSSVCSPTRAAMLAGTYPDLAGVPGVIRTQERNNWGFLSTDLTLLPEALLAANYRTALIGKWHLGLNTPNTPNERGFEHFHGFLGDMMDDYWGHQRHGINYLRLNSEEISPEGHATDLFSQWAIDYLQDASDERPFFLFLSYNAPHTPIHPPEDWLERTRQREPGISEARAKLVALIEHLDDGVGQVMAALESSPHADNTLVIFVSDNGGQLDVAGSCGPLRGGKQDLYEGGIRVPMIAYWPGRIAAGSRSEAIALTMDLYPTVLAAAGVERAAPDGISILPVLLGEETALPDRDLIWMRREGGNGHFGFAYYAVRRGPWKLVQNRPFEGIQLFNLDEDPLETRNVVAEESAMARELSFVLQRHLQRSGSVRWQQPPLE